jgi:hypothetical protein
VAKAKKKSARPTKKRRTQSWTRAKPIEMIVIVADDYRAGDVARDLKTAGFEVDEVLEGINQVTGRAAPHLKTRLESVRGVKEVQQMHKEFDIGPPDSKVS